MKTTKTAFTKVENNPALEEGEKKITNKDALEFYQSFLAFEDIIFKTRKYGFAFDATNVELSRAVIYAVRKNLRVLKPLRKEFDAILEDFKKVFDVSYDFKEDEYQKSKEYRETYENAFEAFKKEDEQVKDLNAFYEKHCTAELHKVTRLDIEESIIPTAIEPWFDFMVLKEEE